MPISSETIEGRKTALVTAARALIREKGGSGFSMRELAKKAEVSPATPYNLLSSKANLLSMVVQEEFEAFREKLTSLYDVHGLDRLLDAIDLLASHYASDKEFYFGLFRSSGTAGEGALAQIVLGAGRAIFRDLVQDAVAEHSEISMIDTKIITDVLLRVLRVTVESWYIANWSAARFRDELAFSARLLLLAEFQGAAADKLRSDLLSLQECLTTHSPDIFDNC